MKNDGLEKSVSKIETEQNPLYEYGFEISSWIKLLLFFLRLFGFFTLLSVIMMYINHKYGVGIKGGPYDTIAQLTLGNFGSVDPLCLQQT